MPIFPRFSVNRLNQADFGEIAFEVMRYTFAIHNQIGRFFDEMIYKQELARRMKGVQLEAPVDIVFGEFKKKLFIDVVVENGAIFEFKSVDRLANRHRAQLLQYLMLADCAHGKLINVRPEEVEHEFVNCQWIASDRRAFRVLDSAWNSIVPELSRFREFVCEMLRDLGTGLALSLYEDALEQTFGGSDGTGAEIAVTIEGHQIGRQAFRLLSPGYAFKLTGFEENLDRFEEHARRLLKHVDLMAVAWVNIGLKEVQFKLLV